MHEEHPAFNAPSPADIPIWRYMDLPKFISMLEDQALHFVRADRISDAFEGASTKFSIDLLRVRFSQFQHDYPTAAQVPADWQARMAAFFEKQRQYTYLNCWHMNEHESAAMWEIYQSGQPQGIAIRSTHQRLSGSLADPSTIYIGTVGYIDYNTDMTTGLLTTLNRFLYKRQSFDYERELRGIHSTWPEGVIDMMRVVGAKQPPLTEAPPGPPVIPMTVNLDELVHEVYVSPTAPAWFADVVRKASARYGHTWTVHHSSLDNDPIY